MAKSFIGSGDEDGATFALLRSADQELVAIVEEHNRDIILALHDFPAATLGLGVLMAMAIERPRRVCCTGW